MPDTADSRVSGEGLVDTHILQELRSIVGERGLISSPEELHTYECDGLTNFRVLPRAVLLPTSTEQVQAIVRLCHREKIPFVARGSGTGLSGGALPVENGIVVSLARMNRILEVDFLNARVIVEPGVINLDVTGRVQPQEYFYAPDPSSQSVCSLGGNVAENCGGLLLVELDGPSAEVEALMAHVNEICRSNGAWEIRVAQSDAERALVWRGRKAAFAAMGRISPNYIVQDGVIPRTALPQVMSEIARLSQETGLRVANVFHAGDGNLHPLVLYDRRIPGQEKAAEALSFKILELCIAAGGSITGEHGVGEEKKKMMSKMFAEPDLDTMQRVRCAFDPLQLSNPTKVFPTTRLCGEKPGEYVPHPLESAGIAERF